jgi:hypothetical protein
MYILMFTGQVNDSINGEESPRSLEEPNTPPATHCLEDIALLLSERVSVSMCPSRIGDERPLKIRGGQSYGHSGAVTGVSGQ